jgi:hypothetical protein
MRVKGHPFQCGFLGESPQALEQIGRSTSIDDHVIQCLLYLLELRGGHRQKSVRRLDVTQDRRQWTTMLVHQRRCELAQHAYSRHMYVFLLYLVGRCNTMLAADGIGEDASDQSHSSNEFIRPREFSMKDAENDGLLNLSMHH